MFGSLSSFEGGLFDEFRHLEREMDRYFSSGPWPNGIRAMARGTYPPINVGLTPDRVVVYLFVPGVDPNNLDITIHQNLLTIKGERRSAREEGVQYYRRERFDGEFHRAVSLPEDADPDQVEASYRNGVLQVTVKRHEATKPRQIEVK